MTIMLHPLYEMIVRTMDNTVIKLLDVMSAISLLVRHSVSESR